MRVTVKKVDGQLVVFIPEALASEIMLIAGLSVDVSVEAGSLVIRKLDRRPRRPLSELIPQLDWAAYKRINAEFETDRPVGKEI